jgi:hypothetical protein
MKTTFSALLLVGGLFLTACEQKDKTAPPAPRVDPFKSPTSSKSLVLTGAAEFASTVKLTGGAEDVTVQADPFTAEWIATVPLNSTIPAGAISVKNSIAVTATDAAGNVSEPTNIEVVFGPEPGKPAELNFTLTGIAASGAIAAGDQVTYTYKVTDAYGGAVTNPLDVVPSWPNAVVFDDGISGTGLIMGMTKAGDFTITARATGATGVSKVVPLKVNVAKGNRYLDMGLTLSRMATGDTTAALTVAKDLYSNVIISDTDGTSPGLTLTCTAQAATTPASACSKAGNQFTITKSGVYKIAATYDDGTNPAATTSQFVFVEDVPDVMPPTAHIDSIIYPGSAVQVPRSQNSRIEVQLTFTDDKGLAQANLYAIFGNNPACMSVSNTLQLTGSLNVTTSVSVRQPTSNCAFPFDSISLFAQVTDRAGNQGFSNFNNTLSISGAGLNNGTPGQNLTPAGGYTVAVVGIGNNLQNGADVAYDSVAQVAYVSGNNRIVAVLPDRTQGNVKNIVGADYQPNNSVGIAVSPAGELFVGHYSTTNITYIPPALPIVPPSLVTGLNGPTRLVYDARPTKPVVCAAQTGSTTNMNCYVFDSTVTPVTLTKNFPTDLVPNPAPTGTLAGIAVGAKDGAGNYTLWLLYSGCALYTTTTKFDATNPTQPAAALPVTPGLGGGTCTDIAALPSGDVAVLDSAGQKLVRVTPVGAASTLITNLRQPDGLDFSGGFLYVLDTGTQTVLQVTAPAGTPF